MKRAELHQQYKLVLSLRKEGLTTVAIAARIGKTQGRVSQILRHEIDREKQIIDRKVAEMTGPFKVQSKTESLARWIVDHFIDGDADELLCYLKKKVANAEVWDFRQRNDCFDNADRIIRTANDEVVRYPRKYRKG